MFVRAALIGTDSIFTTIHQGPIRGYRSGTNFLQLAGSEYTTSIAASGNGRWIAAGYWNEGGARLWDAQTGELIRQFSTLGSTLVMFTADSQWLVTGAPDEYQFWDATSGARGLRIPRSASGTIWGPMAFTRDGKVMAIARSRWLVQLIEVATGRELAALEQPDAQTAAWLAFDPSGTRLAVASDVIHVWDLRRLRRELAELKLDWDQPSLQPADSGAPATVPIKALSSSSTPPR
jgi:WD40 repeat protein